MYIIFLLLSPVALYVGSRWSWKLVLIPSGLIWVSRTVWSKNGDLRAYGPVSRIADTVERDGCI